MSMPLLKDIIGTIENFAPTALQETYDNCGLLYGNEEWDISSALLTLDCTEEIVDEAIALKAGLIIAHHPILFAGIKSLTGKNYVEKTLLKAIKNDIAIYAAHTNMDNILLGVNKKIADTLLLTGTKILASKKQTLKQLYVYVPMSHSDKVQEALWEAGAGNIGNYSHCSYNIHGEGTFMPLESANPFLGEKDKLQKEKETKIEVVFPYFLQSKVIAALKKAHPYEEIAYGVINLENNISHIGSGIIGELENEMEISDFLSFLKEKMHLHCIKHTQLIKKTIKKIAICGGSGSFLISNAIQAKADIYITADIKYHQFFDAEDNIIIADIGHYESEQFTPEIFLEILSKKFPTFALHLSKKNTNPINYF